MRTSHQSHFQPRQILILANLLLACSAALHSQVRLSFTGIPTVKGTSGTVGATYTYPNIGSTKNVTVRGVLELINKTGTCTLADIDLATGGSAAAWQPLINGSAAANASWSMRFKLTFYNAATGNPLVLTSYNATAVDIDGDNANLREYVEYYAPTSYTVETPTKLTITRNNDRYNFLSPKQQLVDIALSGTSVIAAARYDNSSSMIIELGSTCIGAACSATGITRQYSINFLDTVKFNDGMIILPVRFLSLHAEKAGHGNKITWRVADEINVEKYVVEKSYDGSNFRSIASLSYAGDGTAETEYTYTDSGQSEGTVYYRINTIDIGGQDYYSHLIKVLPQGSDASMKILGDPVGDELWFNYTSPEAQQIDVEIISESGQVLRDFRAVVEAGSNRIQYPDVNRLVKGAYIFIAIDRHGVSLKQQFIKM